MFVEDTNFITPTLDTFGRKTNVYVYIIYYMLFMYILL